ncbi:MAG TPA: hypothetical protein PLB07_03680 [Bacteroidales bacterium]|nr:hypothetical protein [Bacteroidales bacterium]
MIIRLAIYLLFAIAIILVYRMKREFIYFIPIFNVLADVSFNYFDAFSAPTILRAVVLMLFLLMFWEQLLKMDILRTMYLFFLYILIVMIFSKELLVSFKAVAQVILSMSVFIAGYKYITSFQRYRKLLESLTWVIIAGFIAAASGYVFDIGRTLEYTVGAEYEGEPEFIGLLGSGGLYGPALALAMLPVIIQNRYRNMPRWVLWAVSAGLYIFIILNVRRTAILIPIIGIVSSLLFYRRQTKVIRYLFFFAVTLALLAPVYRPLLEKRIEARAELGRFEKGFMQTESRYLENLEMIREIREFKDPLAILSGIGHNIFAEHTDRGEIVRRMYHSDTAKLIYGTGLIGLFLYVMIYGQLLYMILKIPGVRILNEYRSGALTIWIISLFVSFNGSITLVTFRTMSFLLMGAFIGMANGIIKSHGALLAVKRDTEPVA